ncbi:MAG: hypothetical protein ACE37K_08270 [Planctomycetota bacterium]
MTDPSNNTTDWLQAFLPLGTVRSDSWEPRGGGVLILDRPVVWLVTGRQVVDPVGDEELATWIPNERGVGLLNLTRNQRQTGMPWVHHPVGLSAAMLPLDPSFRIKAFAETQCTRVRDLQPMQPAASVGRLYGPDIAPDQAAPPAVLDGIISAADAKSGSIFTTAPMLPRNLGAPLVLASPYGGPVTLAGILLGNTMVNEPDPRMLPVRLGRAICVDAAWELVRGAEASEQRRRVTASEGSDDAERSDEEPTA